MQIAVGITIALLTICGNVYGGTILVPGDQPTIQAGINAASTDDIVLVAAGTYQEYINFHGNQVVVTTEL